MKHRIIPCILTLGIVLPLLVVFMPASPALAAPRVSLSPTSGARGTEVSVTGTNFASYIGDIIHIFFGGVEIADSPISVPDTGALVITFDVPGEATPGIAYITFTDQNGIQLGKSNPFTIIDLGIRIEPEDGIVGTNVTIYGKGLYADRKVTFYYLSNDARLKLGVEVASPIGECTCSFTVPDSISGSHQVIARDAGGNQAETYFEVLPSINLVPMVASIGANLAVNGTGFGFKNDVSVYLGGGAVATTQTDEYGSLGIVFNVPQLKSGTYDIEVEDMAGNTARVQFSVISGINLSKVTGHIGEVVTVNGAGFVAGKPVAISYDSVPVAEGVVNAWGRFSVTFDVPASGYGNHEVVASDGTNIVTSLLNVESVAPPVPELILPADETKVEALASFDWEDVTDPSGVTYTLQVTANVDFSSIILEKTGLTFSEYVITKEERLRSTKKEAPYYWRVKAVDGATNESDWSTPGSFYVGFSFEMPTWATVSLIVLGALLIGFVAFRLGRRTAYYEDTF